MAEIGDIGGSGLGGAGRWGVYQEWGRTGLEAGGDLSSETICSVTVDAW